MLVEPWEFSRRICEGTTYCSLVLFSGRASMR
jgi:hypothetical protein